MADIDLDLPQIVLSGDSVEDLRLLSANRIREASGDLLTDFRAGSPLAALVEGQVFALAELLYYINLLPAATALELFRFYGVERSLGTQASGSVTFLLQNPSALPFTLAAGYTIPYRDSYLELLEDLYIPAGAFEADVSVSSQNVGSVYNADSYGVLVTSPSIPSIQSIYNKEPLTGGGDLESMESAIERLQRKIRTRSTLLSVDDYQQAAEEILGVGSRAVCIPRLSSDKATLVYGDNALFLLDSTGLPVSVETAKIVKDGLVDRLVLGSYLWCFPMELEPIVVEVVCTVDELTTETGQRIADTIIEYLNPATYNGGYKIRHLELSYTARQDYAVLAVDSVKINGDAIDLLLPNAYTLPFPDTVAVTMLDRDGNVLEYFGGKGDGQEDY